VKITIRYIDKINDCEGQGGKKADLEKKRDEGGRKEGRERKFENGAKRQL